MNSPIKLQPHPFRLLLYLEWILLVIALLTEFPLIKFPYPPFLQPVSPQNLLLLFLSLASFGIMGLRLPGHNLLFKALYIGLGFCLILLVSVAGGRGMRFPPSLLLILVLRSCLVFQLTQRLLVASLAFISFVFTSLPPFGQIDFVRPPLPNLSPPDADNLKSIVWQLTFNSALLFGLVLVFVLLLVNALLGERQSREKLAIAHQQLREYSLKIENQATLQERNRIAREIHDALGHSLTAQSIQLENALLFLSTNLDETRTFLLEAKQLGTNALREVRQSVATLRFDPLQGKSLASAIALLLTDFQRRSGIIPKSTLSLPLSLSPEVSTTIYRIIQEALTNISKHGAATQVKINLQATLEHLYLQVEDNGKGFNPNQNTTGFGIQGMRERTLALGGEFKIISTLGAGCQITAIFYSR
ncbi:sensor histidine kinase [Cylindrospermum sp. FACHB-282]|uniref:sensor histidine kinase n=1 Tax=Cylindrospermum sp. FACHB-282 TaxID=2692794 RepID=UPI002815B73C|nr:sensor histidine kinase [Cylindrospermum sp. FACHB-282]